MNARAIKKRLMRSRSGYRAYLTVRLPLSLAGNPPPDIRELLPDGFNDDFFEGTWVRNEGMDHRMDEQISIQQVCSGSDPRTRDDLVDRQNPVLISQPAPGVWKWWYGYWSKPTSVVEQGQIVYTHDPIPDEWVERYAAEYEWKRRLFLEPIHPVFDVFQDAANWGKTFDHSVVGNRILIHYTVKKHSWRDFCKAIRKAMSVARKAGVDARVWKRG